MNNKKVIIKVSALGNVISLILNNLSKIFSIVYPDGELELNGGFTSTIINDESDPNLIKCDIIPEHWVNGSWIIIKILKTPRNDLMSGFDVMEIIILDAGTNEKIKLIPSNYYFVKKVFGVLVPSSYKSDLANKYRESIKKLGWEYK